MGNAKKRKGKKNASDSTRSISSYFSNKAQKGSEDKKESIKEKEIESSSGSQGQVSEIQETEPGSQESLSASQGSQSASQKSQPSSQEIFSGSQKTSLRSRSSRKRIIESSDDSDQKTSSQTSKDKNRNKKTSSKNSKDIEKSKPGKSVDCKDAEKQKYRIPKLGRTKSSQAHTSSQSKSSTSKKKYGGNTSSSQAKKDADERTASSESDETLAPLARQIFREVRHEQRKNPYVFVPPPSSNSSSEDGSCSKRQSRITEYLGKEPAPDPELEAIMNEKCTLDFSLYNQIPKLLSMKPKLDEEMKKRKKEYMILEQLDKLRKERLAKEKIENLAWRDRLDEITNEELLALFHKYLPTLKAIESGDHESWRHDKFYAPGAANRDGLLFAQIEDPFTTPQVDLLYKTVKNLWAPTEELWYEHRSYIAKVLVPELLLFIYQDLFGVNRDDAERRIRETPFRYDPKNDVSFLD